MIGQRLQQRMFKGVVQNRIRHVAPVRYHEATGLVGDVYRQMERDFELVPPLTVHSPVPELLAGAWCLTRETLVAGKGDRARREAIAAAVSDMNTCPFCVDVHVTMLSGAKRDDVVAGIAGGASVAIADGAMRSLVEWARATRSPGAKTLALPPFAGDEAAELRGTAVAFHYMNRIVNVFMSDGSPLRLPRGLGWFKGTLRRVAGRVVGRRLLRQPAAPGDSLELLAGTDWADDSLPAEFAWAVGNEKIAAALAHFAAAAERAGGEFVPTEVRHVVQAAVNGWHGEDPPLGREWVEEAIVDLNESERAAARIGLLTALASYRIDERLIADYRQYERSDAALVALVGWSSAVAARRLGSWLA